MLRSGPLCQLLLVLWVMGALSLRAQSNGVLREVFYNIGGSAVADLTNAANFPANADQAFIENAFEAPSNFSDNYGQRMRALLCPPVTGTYTFWIASDDNSVLFLSRDEDPAHKTQIASETQWTNPRQYTLHPSQKSAPITLTNGLRYYIEALQKEGTGGDNLAVTWQKPGDPVATDNAAPIPGTYLVPYGLGPPVIATQPTNVAVTESGNATFVVKLTQNLGATFQWRRGGVAIAGATNSVYSFGPVGLSDSGSQFRCFITNSYGNTNSAAATLTVNPDVIRPVLVSVSSLGEPQTIAVVFSEPVEAASATAPGNYFLSGGISVLAAAFGMDTRTILLTTTPMAAHTTYTLTVNNVRDRASMPNLIWPNSQRSFSLDLAPLDSSFLLRAPETIGASTRHGPVVISELMYHPAARADGRNLEYVELFNSNPFSEDISGYRLSGEIEFTFPPNTVVAARGYLVVAAAPADLQSVYGSMSLQGPYTNRLSNGSGTVRLHNRQGGILFEATYSSDPPWPAAADGAGHSLVLAWPSLGERTPAAWAASAQIGGSPGRAEPASSSAYRTVLINEFLAHTDPPDLDFIELFNYSGSAIDLSGCILTDDPATNRFVIPTNTVISPQGFVSFNETQLGFRLSADGETLYLKDPGNLRVIDAVRFAGQENGVSMGRYPDGAKGLYRLQTKTPGAANGRLRVSEVVINEIMYDPISGNDDDQYVELYNRSAAAVDVSRWSFVAGINYSIPGGTVIPAHGYLVVARNAARLLTLYTNLNGANTLGDFGGALAHGGERLALAMPDDIVSTNSAGKVVTNQIHIVVDELTYGTGGRWGQWAHGGGSSLELLDPRNDHRLAANWADSDESAKSGWTTIEATGVLDNGNGTADSLHLILLGPGECLVDNVEVSVAGGANLVTNPDFESGLTGWVAQGNHEDSSWESGQGYNSSHCLRVRAPDHGDTGANRIRTTLKTAPAAGQTATLRARVRWLAGRPEILLRLRGNWLEATGNTLTAGNLGSPGAPNSRAKANVGPAIADVNHSPALPTANQSVTVVARVQDADGLAGLLLKYRVDPATNFNLVPMVNNSAGLFSAVLPGQAAGTLVAFHIQAMDNGSPREATLFPNDAPKRECLVRWGDPVQSGNFGTYRLWMTQATFDRWSKRERLSNQPLDCTFVYGNSRVIYNVGGQYSGSPYHSPGFDSPTGNVCDYLLSFPEDDRLLGETAATLQWPGNGGGDNSYQREQTAYWIAEQMGLPYCYRRSVNLYVNGVRRAEMFEDAQQPNGDMVDAFYPEGANGDLHKVQLWFEFDDAASSFTGNGASLQNVTTTGGKKKLAVYRWTWAKRAVQDSASNYTNLFALVDAVNFSGLGEAYRRQLETVVDVDNWLKTYAVEHVVGNSDSFAYGGGQNMYCYKPVADTWKMLIWDIDFAFAAQPANSDVFQGIGRSNGIDLGEPGYLRPYWQILQDLATGPLSGTKLYPLLDAKYNAMMANLRTVENPTAIKTFVSQRRAYLLDLIATNAPAKFALTLNNGVGFSTNRNCLALTGTAPLGVRLITINGVAVPVTWTSVSNWTAQVVLSAGTNTLLVQGWDAVSNAVTGASATLPISYTGSVELAQDRIVINEIMYHPMVPDASFVELYNTSATSAFDLSGWKLSGADFVFPGGTILVPNGYLVIASDKLAFAGAYGGTIPVAGEFNGKLQNSGETLRLIQPGSTPGQEVIIDEVRYDSRAPWPAAADGTGASLQLVDPAQDNNRVANWAAVPTNSPPPGPGWRYVVASGTASSSTLYIYLQSAGETYIDDIRLVAGTTPEIGPNLLPNGDFESAFPGPWGVSPNLSASAVSSSIRHAGNGSLHVIASIGGTSRSSSIYQDLATGLVANAPYTLSFWVLENTNGGTLTVRLSGNGIVTNVNLLPGSGGTSLVRCTPGAPNSVRASLPPLPRLWLNEVLPTNLTGLTDRFGHRHPWVELYNNGPTNLSLAGMFLANSYSNLLQWPFPAGTTLGAGKFLVVWLDGNAGESVSTELHTSFSLSPGSGSLALVSTNGGRTNLLDYLNYDLTHLDRSYGACPDGQGSQRQVFYYPTPGGTNNPASPPLNVVFNEWMADNVITLADPADNQFEDWFELYNPGDTLADLSGFYLGTSLTNKTKFQIPEGYTIPAHGYLLVWADDESSQNSSNRTDLHVNFKLSKGGEAIGLFAPDGTVIDFVSFVGQATDVSEGRFPDGAAYVCALTQPTPRAANLLALANTPPVLGSLSNRTVFEGQMVVFTATAIDTDLPAQQLGFSLDPGAPANAVINPETGLFSWRPTAAQTPGTNLITLRVSDNGVPPLSSTGTFLIRVVPRPQVTSIVPKPSSGCSLSFETVPNRRYRLEFKDSLQDSAWQVLVPEALATTESLTLQDEIGGSPQRFYRIVVLD